MPYRVILICLLMGAYLLTANDRVQSADGYAILATAKSGNISIMGAVDYLIIPKGRMGTFGLDGELYSKKGITPSIALLPLVWINDILPNAPLQATAHLFNGVVSTLTALVLFGFIARLGYDKRVAFIVALMFGLGTLYLVYARTLFGEPLAGLLIILCFYLIAPVGTAYMPSASSHKDTTTRHKTSPLNPLSIVERGLKTTPKQGFLPLLQTGEGGRGDEVKKMGFAPSSHHVIILGILLGLLAGINLTYIAFAPIFALYILSPRQWGKLVIMGVGFIITAGILVGLVNLSRYGSLTETGYKFGAGEGFTTPLFTGLYGLFFSPWRGILWYMPLFWLLPVGWWFLQKKYRSLAWVIIACIAVQSVIYALWWSWHGGVVWGARFLVPIIPIAMIGLAPIIQWMFVGTAYMPSTSDTIYRVPTPPTRWVIVIAIISLFILSIGLQLLGTLYDFNTHEGVLYAVHEDKLANALMFHPELSAITANLTMLKNGDPINWSWAKNGDMVAFAVAVALIGLGILLMVIRHRAMQAIALIGVCVGMGIFAIRGESGTARDNREALQTALSPSAPIIATTDDTTFINLRRFGDIATIYAPTAPDEPFTRQLWKNATDTDGLRWFVTWFNPSNPENWAEKDLFIHHAFVKEVWAGGYRGVLFYLHPPISPYWINQSSRFGDVVILNRYSIGTVRDSGIFIMLDWELLTALPADWGWFVHVLDENGQIIAQQDRLPLGGFLPTEDTITEHLYFIISPENAVSVRIGWVQNGALVPVDGVTEGFIVLPIR
jgi:hypothetical protein